MTTTITSEPLTYGPDGRHSYFLDLMAHGAGDPPPAVRTRLERHASEMRVERLRRDRDLATAERRMTDDGISFEKRVNPDRTPGQGGNFDPPIWLIDQYAARRRPERVIADLARNFPLPIGVQSVNVPILSTGTLAQGQPDLAADSDQDIVDAATSSSVVTVSGQLDASLQLMEQSPRSAAFDSMMFEDLMNAADADLESMLTTGNGSVSGQFTGLTNIAGTTTVSYTSGSPTGTGFYTALSQAGSQLADARNLRPDAYVMRFARWAWLSASQDSQGRPLGPPADRFTTLGSNPNGPTPIGTIVGIPVVTSESLPSNLGAGSNQDTAYAVRSGDFLLFEGEPNLTVGTEVLSGTLGVRIQLRKYAAAILGRYPSGIAQVTGTGMVVQSGW